MKLRDFKNEFRLVCCDTWGDAVEAWFECAGHLRWRNKVQIPNEWEYRQGAGLDPREKDSYWFSLFRKATDRQLLIIGNFLFRYCQYLKHKGIDY